MYGTKKSEFLMKSIVVLLIPLIFILCIFNVYICVCVCVCVYVYIYTTVALSNKGLFPAHSHVHGVMGALRFVTTQTAGKG